MKSFSKPRGITCFGSMKLVCWEAARCGNCLTLRMNSMLAWFFPAIGANAVVSSAALRLLEQQAGLKPAYVTEIQRQKGEHRVRRGNG